MYYSIVPEDSEDAQKLIIRRIFLMPSILATGTAGDLSTFTGFATEILTWLVTTFSTILSFMLANPICFVGLIVGLVVTAIGTLRHLIGG